MSWQLGAGVVLALALAGGAAWYERSRPDARTVALVATLAALAALGRIAFAALPNIKPSTDIVLIAGVALGAAPGFMVGALCGLASNLFFGQGPWTPWQMAAWGVAGMLGAALGVGTRGQVGRWTLAVVCGVTGLLFTAVQDVGDWVNFSDHSAAQLEVYLAKGFGFDLLHAAGCVAFALLFGPALLGSLQRIGRRCQTRWLSPEGAVVPGLLIAGVLLTGVVLPAAPARAATAGPAGAAAYLRSAENRDGGLGAAPGGPSAPIFSGWGALGLAAAGVNPADVNRGGRSLLDYVAAGASATDPGSIERTILVARAAGVNPSTFSGVDLIAALRRHLGADGSVGDQVNLTVFAVLALRAAGDPVASRTVAWLEHQQNGDGGFGFTTAGAASDPDDTGAALEALAAVRAPAGALARAVGYLRREQNRDGGLPTQEGGTSDAQSTAWGVQGLLAAGVDPAAVHRAGSPSPLAYLTSLQAADGHIRYARGTDQTPVWVTGEALMALARRPLPLAPVTRRTAASPVPRSRPAARPRRKRSRATSHTGQAGAALSAATAPGAATPLRTTAPGRAKSLHIGELTIPVGALVAPDVTALMSVVERLLAPVGLGGPPRR